MKEFKKYQHLVRYGHSDCQGINEGICHVFPKIDGTNACIWMGKDGKLKAGSRNRELTLEADNHGFYQWVLDSEYTIRLFEFFNDHPCLRLFGEWLVPHTLKTYRDDAWRRFYVFDVVRMPPQDDSPVYYDDFDTRYMHYDEYAPLLEEYGIDYIPCIKIIQNGLVEDFEHELHTNDYLMQPGHLGEGIVIKNYGYKNKYGRQNWAKIVRAEFKEKHYKDMGAPIHKGAGDKLVERVIADTYVTKALVDKERAKIHTEPVQPRLLSTVYHCILTEEIADIVKKMKNPTINFKQLQTCVNSRVKALAPDLF